MPIPIIVQGVTEGLTSIPYAWDIIKLVPWALLLAALKYYFRGAQNTSERVMHSKVVMVTGGTSGIGASVVHGLASRGAQVILLTQHSANDIFLTEYIDDLRAATNNQLIYAEQVDLSSLHSIRTFATKWIDNVPPRRLDMVILCGNTNPPPSKKRLTVDGLDEEWMVNYLANFHLLSILSPALRVQPAYRDVRVIFAACSGYIGAKWELGRVGEAAAITAAATESAAGTGAGAGTGKGKKNIGKRTPTPKKKKQQPISLYGLSKLSLMIFAQSFQKHLNAFKRPDGQQNSTRVIMVDPGFSRTPGFRRWMTGGSLWGLFLYLLTWPVWWLVLKSPQQGAQSILYAAMEGEYGKGEGGWMIKECKEVDVARREVKDEGAGKLLWQFSEKMIEAKETESAVMRAMEKKEREREKQEQEQGKTSGTGTKEQTPGSRRSRKGK
ncbi:NAD(P)-binding protein [Aspergillus heteromorphus CBS 117.55]|uniref:NAD(P)-binding protein n=1 Tax=Aspergillus heteromorphus CBS 117.55 TaxID=1448321 RepID=A0A317W258_9EURO|nr:NAD(P)-binding protein [Aspergillus heteromorphus CBS 117.55]PWY79268.1 NAD(P)-binding protein [Aspergillus heteromorphus CBS 117.55]